MPLFYKYFYIVYLQVCLIMVCSCKKAGQIEPNQQFAVSSEETTIQSIYFLNDSNWFACGGIPNKNGFLSLSSNKGKTWVKIYENSQFCLNTINFSTNSIGFCGGDKLLMLKTNNKGKLWKEQNYPKPYPEMTLSIRKIFFVDSTFGTVVSGNNYEKGSSFKLYNNRFGNKYYEFNHELRDVSYFNSREGIYCSNGAIYKTIDGGKTYTPCNIKGDFFIGITSNQNTTWVCGYNGGIYKTNDKGSNWETIQTPNRASINRKNYICIFSKENIVLCGGTKGLITYTKNNGLSWTNIVLDQKLIVNCINENNGIYYAACSNGKIVPFTID